MEWWITSILTFLFLALFHRKYYNTVFQQHSKACTIRFLLMLFGIILQPFLSWGILLFICGALINDEWMRNAWHHRTIYFCGIDGSGKSSHAKATVTNLRTRKIRADLLHFYKNPATSTLSRMVAKATKRPKTVKRSKLLSGFRAYAIAIDNMLYVSGQLFIQRLRGIRITIADRHLYDYYLRNKLLQYPTNGIGWVYTRTVPREGVCLDIDPTTSHVRRDHEHAFNYYVEAQQEYCSLARKKGYPIIRTNGDFGRVQEQIEQWLFN